MVSGEIIQSTLENAVNRARWGFSSIHESFNRNMRETPAGRQDGIKGLINQIEKLSYSGYQNGYTWDSCFQSESTSHFGPMQFFKDKISDVKAAFSSYFRNFFKSKISSDP
jgi:hypothetical protein